MASSFFVKKTLEKRPSGFVILVRCLSSNLQLVAKGNTPEGSNIRICNHILRDFVVLRNLQR